METGGTLYSTYGAARRVGISQPTVWGWIQRGDLPAVKLSKQYAIREDDLLATAARMFALPRRRARGTRKIHGEEAA